MTSTSDHKNLQKKKLGGSGITPSYFSTLMIMEIFGHFLKYRAKGKTMILNVLWCSNHQMQKMTSLTPSFYEAIYLKVFFKKFALNFSPISRF